MTHESRRTWLRVACGHAIVLASIGLIAAPSGPSGADLSAQRSARPPTAPGAVDAAAPARQPAARPSSDAPVADFRDLATAAGFTTPTIIGGERTKTYILETTGGGAAIVDYDNDGWPDVFLVNGARLPSDAKADAGTAASADAPTGRLYRNNGRNKNAPNNGRSNDNGANSGPSNNGPKSNGRMSNGPMSNGTASFTDVTAKAGLLRSGWGQAVCAGDYDNDGHVDLFVTYYGDQVLYRNNGDGTFTDVTARSALPTKSPRWHTGAAFLDFDRDGHLDLFVTAYVAYEDAMRHAPGSRRDCFWKGLAVMCGPQGLAGSQNALYRNNGDGTFTDLSEKAGLLKARPAYGLTPLVLDYDNDGAPDVYVANDSTASLLFHNNGDGTFKEVGLQAGVALTADGRAQAGMGVSAADYDRDGLLDIVKTNFDDDTTSLYRNLGGGMFEDATFAGGLGVNTRYLGWGTGFFDFDRDGFPDILTVNGHVYPEADKIGGHYSYAQRKLLYRNVGGRFVDVSARAGPGVLIQKAARGAAFGDLFNTGQQDVVINNMHDTPTLLHDCAPTTSHALSVKLVGTKSNRSAIGARVTVHVNGRRLIDEVRSGGSFCSQNDLRIHVGLGSFRRADRIEIAWPSGAKDIVTGVAADQLVVIREGAGLVQQEPFATGRMAACNAR